MSDDTPRLQPLQFIRRTPQPLTEHLGVARAQWSTRLYWPSRYPLDNQRCMRQGNVPKLRMIDPLETTSGQHILVVHDFCQIPHRSARNTCGQHQAGDLVPRVLSGPTLQQLVNHLEVLDTRRASGDTRILFEVRTADDLENGPEMMIRGRVHNHKAIGGPVCIVGRDSQAAMSISRSLRRRGSPREQHAVIGS